MSIPPADKVTQIALKALADEPRRLLQEAITKEAEKGRFWIRWKTDCMENYSDALAVCNILQLELHELGYKTELRKGDSGSYCENATFPSLNIYWEA